MGDRIVGEILVIGLTATTVRCRAFRLDREGGAVVASVVDQRNIWALDHLEPSVSWNIMDYIIGRSRLKRPLLGIVIVSDCTAESADAADPCRAWRLGVLEGYVRAAAAEIECPIRCVSATPSPATLACAWEEIEID